jgi:UDP-N-acetylglucosamine diphosphorylase / glucose-1-phosphate thymidylyltransferase / UDP-N-acetylgalactosamine diphosphorylase / glucosamine-1-phosphate N-acetyltransferase / galactosamine-1-phosphate N-acetyltransferase
LNIILDVAHLANWFQPFCSTRAVADLRVGVSTLRQKWERLGIVYDSLMALEAAGGNPATCLVVNEFRLPTPELITAAAQGLAQEALATLPQLQHAADLFLMNDMALRLDIAFLQQDCVNWQPIPAGVTAVQSEQIFIAPGAVVEACYLNASAGPIYFAAGATVMAGSYLRGPVAVCEGAAVKMGATIYGATTIGPYCIAGGEIKNSVMMGYSNKAHHGYLGDSVLGEWCNLGAGTSNSNIKNTAGDIVYSFDEGLVNVGIKGGLFMGDYSRSAINTSFNTGSMVGVCCNVFGDGLTPKLLPHFSWGTAGDRYRLEKAFEDIDNWKRLKKQSLTDTEKQLLTRLYEQGNL